jgi:hypothetical protein
LVVLCGGGERATPVVWWVAPVVAPVEAPVAVVSVVVMAEVVVLALLATVVILMAVTIVVFAHYCHFTYISTRTFLRRHHLAPPPHTHSTYTFAIPTTHHHRPSSTHHRPSSPPIITAHHHHRPSPPPISTTHLDETEPNASAVGGDADIMWVL